MTSQDAVIVDVDGMRYSVISDRLAAIEAENREMHRELREIHAEIRVLAEETHVLAARVQGIEGRIDDMKLYVSLAFGALAVFVGVAALIPLVSKLIQGLRKPSLTAEQVNAMINDALSRALNSR